MFIQVGSFFININNVVYFKETDEALNPQTPYGLKFVLVGDREILFRYNTEKVRDEQVEEILTQIG